MKETELPAKPDAKSPAGADIRFIMDGTTGNMIHSTLPAGQTNRATIHKTISEFWYILEGAGEIWRKDNNEERITSLGQGVSIDIPVGTAFQYRNTGAVPMKFICISMPPWPGDAEASHLKGAWEPTI
ncbi:MAG: cupin domain-containing protein [Rhodobacteraceae bacterium]|nr:cupin domain-containing protein [Paracoccaceae bacterium]